MYLRCPSIYFQADGTAQCPLSAAEKVGYQETGFYVSYYVYSINDQTYSGHLLKNFIGADTNVIDSGSASALIVCSMLVWGLIFRAFS